MKRLHHDADRGDAVAQFNLGLIYDDREDDDVHAIDGKRPDAIKWLSRAARQGLPRAQVRLAELYAEDPYASKDALQACTWFLLAAEGLSGARRQNARSGYERVASQLTAPQIAQAHRHALVWRLRTEVRTSAARLSSGLGRTAL
ncbi:sel1 repeat family protein [Mycobacterium sp. KBS0706]|uniref:tetratricopeptide repeat protein n=1 Tax=Mycobacterium sp. KBS0706 TaxID=2578109 RepID=UPI00110FA2B8|nr:SEL1-like repeat protein [Mycobacterium sp. KBS0706]TSD83292.1 sel1 repeat family protein [Mycobacterium sp. KBS0706]